MKKYLITLAIGAILLPTQVQADQINLTVTGNGADSVNQIEQSSQSETQVSQTNQSEVVNDISVSSDTGNNSVSDNTGDQLEVKTGDVDQQIVVENQNINSNTVTNDCNCEGQTSQTNIKIADNGSGSTNTVATSTTNTTQVVQNNIATITTTVNIKADTGNNTISNNTGSIIDIKTGDIYSQVKVENKNVNNSTAVIAKASNDYSIKIAGNGTDSDNNIQVHNQNNVVYLANNQAFIGNNIYENFNTGGNYINGNTAANIKLKTGSVKSIIAVVNKGINGNSVIISDCWECNNGENPGGENPENPENPGNGGDNGNGGSNGGGNSSNGSNNGSSNGSSSDNNGGGIGGPSNGQILGTMLPATGGSLAYVFGANLAMFLTGLWLKLKKSLVKLWNSDLLISIEIV